MKKKTILTEKEIDILKSARKILKKLHKKSNNWENKLREIEEYSAVKEEYDKLLNWEDEIYKEVKVEFDNDSAFLTSD